MFKRSSLPFIAMILTVLANIILPGSVTAQVIPGTSIPTTVTRLMIHNGTASSITIGFTVQAISGATQDGCGITIANLQMIDNGGTLHSLTVNPMNSSQGTFPIPGLSTYELVSTLTNPDSGMAPSEQNCLQGLTATFGAWQQCPNGSTPFPVPSTIPNGVNQYEATLNLPGTIGGSSVGGNETMDLTCLNGANSLMQVTINSPSVSSGAMVWTYDQSKTVPLGGMLTSSNSWVNVAKGCDNNCSQTVNGVTSDRPFVYPFGCTLCNEYPNPVFTCGQFCAAQNGLPPNTGCTIDRSPGSGIETQKFGGTILLSYLGPATPPATCNGGGGGNHKLPPNKCMQGHAPVTAKQLRDFYLFKANQLKYHLEMEHAHGFEPCVGM